MTIDDRARQAADALHAEVRGNIDTDAALEQVLAARRPRARRLPLVAAAAAVVALALVSMAVVGAGDDDRDRDDEVAIDHDPDPGADGTALQLLAPDDGRQSIGLPVAVEPGADLVDGQTVQVSASGFEPGESVGVVQCTADAREPVYAGADACRTSPLVQLTADADGTVSGEFTVSRSLTVAFSGTVDCAAAPGACLIGVGALSNDDRSGGATLTFAAAEGTVARPTVEASQTAGLADGQQVRVTGSGFTGDVVGVAVCATSPAVCWSTGRVLRFEPAEDVVATDGADRASIQVAGDGTIDGEVAVWRFLPGDEPGTYVDCLVSACSLRFTGELAPPPVPLSFAGEEPPPRAPTVEVTPSEGLRPGSDVAIIGSGFDGGVSLLLSLCAVQPAAEASPTPGTGSRAYFHCLPIPPDSSDVELDDDGGFSIRATLGSFDSATACASAVPVEGSVDCPPGVTADWTFELQTYAIWTEDPYQFARPTFSPLPVRLDYTP